MISGIKRPVPLIPYRVLVIRIGTPILGAEFAIREIGVQG
jgi:hypothetical protein